MIKEVQLRTFRPNDVPHKFEAGTPAIAEAIGLGAAVDYLTGLGMQNVARHEHEVVEYALERLEEVPGVRVLGPSAPLRGGVVSFTLTDAHPHDVAQVLDRSGIAVRAGHHCAMPLHAELGIPASSRASFYVYSRREEVDALIDGLYAVKKLFS
jgi:cysteine desulfurase/selenocysteine lyase